MVARDKLFNWLFQERAQRLQPLVASLLPRMEDYEFSAPVLKERSAGLDPRSQIAADSGFLLRL